MNKEQRKQLDQEKLNPFSVFNPDDFEPLASEEEKQSCYRKRVIPPKELPTFAIKPKEILEGQMIGMYESKQDIYLTFAWKCNELQKEIDLLNAKIKILENKII